MKPVKSQNKGIALVFFLFSGILILSLYMVVARDYTDSVHVRPAVMKIVKDISKAGRFENRLIGMAGKKSKQWERFEQLNRIAQSAELRELTQYNNAVVRCYAFHGLALRKDTAVFSIMLAHVRDTAMVEAISFDMGWETKVGDYFIDVITTTEVDLKTYKMNTIQKEKLDSILLYDKHVVLAAKNKLLHNLKPEAKNYSRIREIAVTENNSIAVVALARYKNPDDLNIISDYLEKNEAQHDAVYAVREFPDAKFYPKLVQIFEREWVLKGYDYPLWRILYQALAKYPTPQTLALFERTLQTKDKFRYQTLGEYLAIALTKYPNPTFGDMKNKIKLDSFHLDEINEEMNNN